MEPIIYTIKRNIVCDLALNWEAFALGVCSFYVGFPGTTDIYVIAPLFWVTNDKLNDFSPGDMKIFSGFNITLVYPL